ncbi:carboxypeptidase-like regulatory domain-containing protein [Saccharothrix obliqua]|uniref:carboxypeptidase-like regulatory domain-containing protein n=1 Tax=Saccharothrix obliqua TaxID=2861747 RepID=UPI001C5CE6CE|nr:carboxypeptidase-like regulatory domain-containing protein [Saccharothrix obliqua]MBW4720555.1 hypothetical protein [Saccharothrix obliqua]
MLRSTTSVLLTAALLLTSAHPATARADDVDLRLTVTFEQTSYFAHEPVAVRATVTNVGTTTATGVHVTSYANLDSSDWAGLRPPGRTLEPGQSAEGRLVGWVTDPTRGNIVRVIADARSNEPDARPDDNRVDAYAPLVILRGDIAAVVYGDRNGNHVLDPGEALPGLLARIVGGRPSGSYGGLTDASGRFRTRGVPIGRYSVEFRTADWRFTPTEVDVDQVDDPDLVFRGEPAAPAGRRARPWLGDGAAV